VLDSDDEPCLSGVEVALDYVDCTIIRCSWVLFVSGGERNCMICRVV